MDCALALGTTTLTGGVGVDVDVATDGAGGELGVLGAVPHAQLPMAIGHSAKAYFHCIDLPYQAASEASMRGRRCPRLSLPCQGALGPLVSRC